MITANSLYNRINEFFRQHGHVTGLVHSTANLVSGNHRNSGEEAEADRADIRTNLLQTTHFLLPVTVGTVDQLLATLFHAGRWPMKTFAAADAAIVIDEIHAYDPHASGLVLLLLSQLRELGARFMVMSATMPKNLQDAVVAALDPGGLARRRFSARFRSSRTRNYSTPLGISGAFLKYLLPNVLLSAIPGSWVMLFHPRRPVA